MNGREELDPPIGLFIAHAPRPVRSDWAWLWRFDQRLLRLASEPGETMLAQIRLAWWRDQLSGQGKQSERRDPELLELDAMQENCRAIVNEQAMKLVDAIEALVASGEVMPLSGAEERGEALARSLARLADEADTAAAVTGRYWGLAQLTPLAWRSGEPDADWLRRIEAAAAASQARWPRALKLMRLHARLLVEAQGRPMGPRAGMRLAFSGLTGL